MKIIRNDLLPLPGFAAMNLFGVLLVRRDAQLTDRLLRHEAIHTAQMRELLYLPFYLLYLAEWLVRLTRGGNAYRQVSFEQEAYAHEQEEDYLASRRPFAWREYLKAR